MKKTLISALILTALFTATGCEDKEAKATIGATNADNCTTNSRKYAIKS